MDSPESSVSTRSWHARLELLLSAEQGRTHLARRAHEGPLYVQRTFRPAGDDALHLYVVHPPGGLVGGDDLEISVRLTKGASALITTPAAQKLYRSQGLLARQRARLDVQDGAHLEWFPAETIVFDGAIARLETSVDLAPGASFCGWDVTCLGRPSAGERFAHGSLHSSFVVRRGQPLVHERLTLEGTSVLDEPWGLAGYPVYGTLYFVPARAAVAAQACERLRSELAAGEGPHAVSAMDDLLVVRALGRSCEQVRAVFVRAWKLLRPLSHGAPACPPRIWST